jgi:hypothetical protein
MSTNENEPKMIEYTCSLCGDVFECEEGDEPLDTIDGYVCKSCESDYFECGACGEYCHIDNRYTAPNGSPRCETCFYEDFFICSGCDGTFELGEGQDGYCYDCRDESYEGPYCNQHFLPKLKLLESETFEENKSKRFVGVEIETEMEEDSELDMEYDDYFKAELSQFTGFKGDSSLNNGREFITLPANGDLLFNNVRKLCKHLNREEYTISKKCGLHIHFDARDLTENDIEKIYYTYYALQDRLFEMVPNSRRTNDYCYKIRNIKERKDLLKFKGDYDELSSYGLTDRYHFVNLVNYYNRNNKTKRTIEIRLHNGTMKASRIIEWIRINQKIIEWALSKDLKRILSLKNRLRTFLNIVNDKGTIGYIKQRRKKFNKKLKRIHIKNIKDDLQEITSIREFERQRPILDSLDFSQPLYKLYGYFADLSKFAKKEKSRIGQSGFFIPLEFCEPSETFGWETYYRYPIEMKKFFRFLYQLKIGLFGRDSEVRRIRDESFSEWLRRCEEFYIYPEGNGSPRQIYKLATDGQSELDELMRLYRQQKRITEKLYNKIDKDVISDIITNNEVGIDKINSLIDKFIELGGNKKCAKYKL